MTTQWTTSAINAIQADYQRSADTHLIPLELPVYRGFHYISKMKALTRPAA